MTDSNKKILSALQSLCARKEYCSSEIRTKALKRCEGDVDAAEEIVAALIEDKFVSDLRYASAFAREKAQISGWGAVKIRYALRGKQIDSQTINAALQEIDADKAEEKLQKVLEVKMRSLAGDPQARLKLIKFALSRGYEYSEVEKYLVNKF
ncbi:MAG: RecX family transcriptional regulator [Bacteroidales bacterium]|nr:RecX family transcriptional regulator [Bacteroidales bacterium]MBQ2006923.1 RecX family transcriptional regulator [Bacteroidales bacterium]